MRIAEQAERTAERLEAFRFRDALGEVPADHPANFVMFVLASMDDPGCLILPYNRVVSNVESAAVVEAWSEGTERAPSDPATVQGADGEEE